MHRFFIDASLASASGSSLQLPEKLAHQVRDVLHLVPGEQLVLLDNSGDEILASVSRSDKKNVEVQIGERRPGKPESPVRIILCQALLKSARFEWILEKGTEMGVVTFAPMLCRRSQSGLDEAGPAKIQRWQRIIQEATEQCGRARLPELRPIRPLEQTLRALPADALIFLAWEEEHSLSLHAALQALVPILSAQQKPVTIALCIGPEGGLLPEEAQLAQQHGGQVVTLGTRILRAETAALVTVANVMFALEAHL